MRPEIDCSKIEINEQFKKALDIMENTSKHIFITGKAGTGKSTLLNYFRQITKKKIVILAPTGVSALNVKGQTIHSFFKFKPDITIDKVRKTKGKKAKIFKELDAIVIDEISMVRADLLDCIDHALRLNREREFLPFGGVQMIFIGDLYQLPPVVRRQEEEIFKKGIYQSPYFFHSKVFQEIEIEFVELEKIYRQSDELFISILNSVRNNTLNDEELRILNTCVGKRFSPDLPLIVLTTTNQRAEKINNQQLQSLNKKIHSYYADIQGEFDLSYFPTEEELKIAEGAQVMLLNNDPLGRWVNGTLAEIVRIIENKKEPDIIVIKLADGSKEEVYPYTWEVFEFKYEEETDLIETEVMGSFTQYPLKLAWAVTIHKSQGLTFPRVVIDLSCGTFAPGQAYVALSRCTSLEGISLSRPFKKGHVFNDPEIVKFLTSYQYRKAEKEFPLDLKLSLIKKAIRENKKLEIIYLKPNGDKTKRTVLPYEVKKTEFRGKSFLGLYAYCNSRCEDRLFRLDRILEIYEK